MIKADQYLDAKGLACPMPIVKTKQAMSKLSEGQVLEIQATDQGSKADLSAWAKSVGHQYLGTNEENNILFHYVRKETSHESEETPYEPTINNGAVLEGDGLILDVREPAEYAFGHIPDAKSIPFGELEERMCELDTEKDIYVICRTGSRSALAARQLNAAGFKNVYNVLPGMTAWEGELIKQLQEEI